MNKLKIMIVPSLLILIILIIGINLDKDDKFKSQRHYPELPKLLFQTSDYLNQKLIGNDLNNQGYIINFFASWCGPCLAEHPTLMDLQSKGVTIIGVNFRDDEENLAVWLEEHGNPFKYILIDNGDIAFEMGLIGVPETYFIQNNKIINKVQGPLLGGDVEEFL